MRDKWADQEDTKETRSQGDILREKWGRSLMNITGDLMATYIYLDNQEPDDWPTLTAHMELLSSSAINRIKTFRKKVFTAQSVWNEAKQKEYPIGYRSFREATPEQIEKAKSKALSTIERIITRGA